MCELCLTVHTQNFAHRELNVLDPVSVLSDANSERVACSLDVLLDCALRTRAAPLDTASLPVGNYSESLLSLTIDLFC
jgi:hypothetical protein